ncbi:MAG: Fur family transcriptional regulator [Chthoniobacterales bacterium]
MKVTRGDIRRYESSISDSGFRFTPQRRVVFDSLLTKRDHPTATEVFMRVKEKMPAISLATVYNCLETLYECGLIRQVHVDREPTRYCPNVKEHAHFVCEECGRIFDIELAEDKSLGSLTLLPQGFTLHLEELNLRGCCAACDQAKSKVQNN